MFHRVFRKKKNVPSFTIPKTIALPTLIVLTNKVLLILAGVCFSFHWDENVTTGGIRNSWLWIL